MGSEKLSLHSLVLDRRRNRRQVLLDQFEPFLKVLEAAASAYDQCQPPSRPDEVALLGFHFAVGDSPQLHFRRFGLAGSPVEIGHGANNGRIVGCGRQGLFVSGLRFRLLSDDAVALGQCQRELVGRDLAFCLGDGFFGRLDLFRCAEELDQRDPGPGLLAGHFRCPAEGLFRLGKDFLGLFVPPFGVGSHPQDA